MLISYSTETCDVSGLNDFNDDDNNANRKVRLMKPTHDSLILRVSCLHTHQTVFNKENSYHLIYKRVRKAIVICIITMGVSKQFKGVGFE